MHEIDLFEAKTSLYEILVPVGAGKSVTITKSRKPIAIRSPATSRIEQRSAAAAGLADIKTSVQTKVTTGGVLQMRHEGRKQ